ncbi:hypothetical protein F511_10170 [Dorcoceras hygrometricum]|uniref:Splicing factor 3B subunit 1-like n=1 Tax=Dorcoceras hygrometricum TaxID=472368 RepID=A0A2Z7B382_9LAMI|nr:hypothetical protein F511_10170 [Dorcoceras hygrometricum]
MASSLISNTNQVHFSSVLSMDNAGMVAMFEALVASGLNGFLGCLSDIYEATLVEFYQNASLPVEGLTDMNEVPKDLVFDARSEFSFTGEQLTNSCKKRELKIEFRLLSDILAKSVTVKAGSFDAVTHERFLMMTSINGGVKINWGRLLFNIFKDMVTPGSRQARGYAVQICVLLKKVPNLDLGDSKEFPPLKILTARTIGRAVSKKRPATAATKLVVKKKRTLKGKAARSNENLELVSVAQEAVPLQVIKPITTAPPKPKRKSSKRRLKLPAGSDDEIADKDAAVEDVSEKLSEKQTVDVVMNEPVVETFVEKEKETSGDVNWGRLLFNIFKYMVTPGSRQARGYGVQICILYISINDKISVEDVEDVGDVSRVKKTPVKRVVSKKRPATTAAELVVKKKRTLKGKAAPPNENLELVSVEQEAVPIQVIKPITAAPPKPKRKASKRRLKLQAGSDDEIADKDAAVEEVAEKLSEKQTANVVMNEPVVETFVEKEKETSGDDVDSIIQQILEDTAQFETVIGEPEVTDFEELVSSNTDGITVGSTEQLVAAKGQQLQGTETEEEAVTTADELLSIEEHLAQIPDNAFLPSVMAADITQIRFYQGIEIIEVEISKASLPQIAETDKGKAPLVEESVQGHPAPEIFSLICADIDFLSEDIYAKEEQVLNWAETDSVLLALQRRAYIMARYRELLLRKFIKARRQNFVSDQAFRGMIKNIRQEAHNDADVFLMKLESDQTQNVILRTELADVWQEVKAQKAELFKEIDDRLATIRSEQLDFRAQAQLNKRSKTTTAAAETSTLDKHNHHSWFNYCLPPAPALLHLHHFKANEPRGSARKTESNKAQNMQA